MSEATPMPVEPPGPSTERLADWQALIERIRQGDRAEVLAWDAAAAGPGATYQVLVTQQARQRLRGAPPLLAGSVAGIIAVLQVDPTEASMIFRRRRLGDAGWTVIFSAARGLLTYWVMQPERIMVLLTCPGLDDRPDGTPGLGGERSTATSQGTPGASWPRRGRRPEGLRSRSLGRDAVDLSPGRTLPSLGGPSGVQCPGRDRLPGGRRPAAAVAATTRWRRAMSSARRVPETRLLGQEELSADD